MMYSNQFAAAIKVGGKFLREVGDTVYLPFGSEYEIRLKNMNSRRAKISIGIDGQDVTDSGLVLDSFKTTDLQRFIQNGNLDGGNRFKFIERTQKIENHRGVQVEDGLILIKFEFEIPRPAPVFTGITTDSWGGLYSNSGTYTKGAPGSYGTLNSEPCAATGIAVNNSSFVNSVSANSDLTVGTATPLTNEAGITVPGSLSNQKFTTTHWRGTEGPVHSMVFRLLGETEANLPIRQPLTVKTKVDCPTCGTSNSPNSKFCRECGTSLQVYASVV
jgi:hypothetical protein